MKTANSFSTSLSATPSLTHIDDKSFLPDNLHVECLLPKVLSKEHDSLPSGLADKAKGWNYSSLNETINSKANRGFETVALPLGEHPAVLHAQDECRSLMTGNDVCVLKDETVKEDVVQVLGNDAELVFPVRNIYRYLVMFIKNMDLFLEIHVEVLDDAQKYRHFTVTNTRSLARVEGLRCQLPLVFGTHPGWRYLLMDLHDLTSQAFGTRHVTTTKVRVGGNCRLFRVFFQDDHYADAELPAYLTFLG